MKTLKFIVAAVIAGSVALGTTACSTGEAIDMAKVNSVIDVRTSGEFTAGHLEGAINIDVEAATFTSEIEKLDKSGKYLVYCHSGRRAGIAVDQMRALGFVDVTNIGGIDAAAQVTKLPVIQ